MESSMKHVTIFFSFLLLLGVVGLIAQQGSSLEVVSLGLHDEAGMDVSGKIVRPSSHLTLEMKYNRRGFPKEILTTLEIQLFDTQGNVLLQDKLDRPPLEGTRKDSYKIDIPRDAQGKFLVVLTLRVSQGDQIFSEVTKTVPFDVSI